MLSIAKLAVVGTPEVGSLLFRLTPPTPPPSREIQASTRGTTGARIAGSGSGPPRPRLFRLLFGLGAPMSCLARFLDKAGGG